MSSLPHSRTEPSTPPVTVYLGKGDFVSYAFYHRAREGQPHELTRIIQQREIRRLSSSAVQWPTASETA